MNSDQDPAFLYNNGVRLLNFFQQTGQRSAIDQAIASFRAAVAAIPAGHPHLGAFLSIAGLAYRMRFQLTYDEADLAESIRYAEATVRTMPAGHPDSARDLANLAGAYQLRFGRSGDRADLDRAMELWQRAEGVWDGEDYAAVLSGLGLAFRMRFEQAGAGADLDEAIRYSERAVGESSATDEAYGGVLSNCAAAYKIRFDLFQDGADLDAAFRYVDRALEVTQEDNPERAGYLCQLATLYQLRFQQTDATEHLDQAIRLGEMGLAETPATHPFRGLWVSDLGLTYRIRFEQKGNPQDLLLAIRYGGEALQATPAGHPERALRLFNLSLAHQAQYKRAGAAEDLLAALRHGRGAVDATPDGHPDRTMFLSNLGSVHFARFTSGAPDGLNLAIGCWRDAATSAVAPPHQRLRAAIAWGIACESLDDPAPAAEAYATAVGVLPVLAWRGLDRSVREKLLADAGGLVPDAAAWAIRAGDLEKAVELLEQGRSVLWSQSLHLRTDLTRLRVADKDLASRLDGVRSALERPRDAAAARELARQWDELLRQVRALPGFQTFLAATPFGRLREAASGGPVIVVNVSNRRCDALIMTTAGVRLRPLALLTADECARRANALLEALYSPTASRLELIALLFATMSWLWDTICEPVLRDLRDHGDLPSGRPAPGEPMPRLWWCPTGPLTVLPLHAAGHHEDPGGECLSQVAISSYTPTVEALARSRERAPGKAGARLLAVGMPTTPRSGELEFPDLDAVPRELQCLTDALPDVGMTVLCSPTRAELDSGTVDHGAAPPTSDRVLGALASHSCVHFACHGGQDLLDPSQGAVYLADGPLTVLRLAGERLPEAELAFLSACQTAVGGVQLPDETIHLAAALQFAGYRHVIATAWSIGDRDAPEVARDTYTALMAAQTLDTSRAAAAIHGAAVALKARHPRRPDLWAPYLHIGP